MIGVDRMGFAAWSFGRRLRLLAASALLFSLGAFAADEAKRGALVLQTDFGQRDHAVAAMRGVARLVEPSLAIDDLTHEIPPFDIWQGAYRLQAVVEYWPAETVFVSVVDPGVGSERESVVARLSTGPMVVTPNNGTLTLLHDGVGIDAVRRIDETKYRLPGSAESHTFHGRDLYVHVGALLASSQLRFEELGELTDTVLLDYEKAVVEQDLARGGIPVLDPQFGNVWTNIPAKDAGLTLTYRYAVAIAAPDGKQRFAARVPFVRTFAAVHVGEPLLYINSIGNLALALNQGSFAQKFGVSSGPGWRVSITPARTAERIGDDNARNSLDGTDGKKLDSD